MCGIFAAIETQQSAQDLFKQFMKIKHRGPDATDFKEIKPQTYFGFHRLAINGLRPEANQPMYKHGVYLVANAEIFNYQQLAKVHQLQLKTGSDCEVIIDLYRSIGIEATLNALDGEFAFVLFDETTDEFFAARDHLGVRGMYFGRYKSEVYIASESKALTFCEQLNQFPPAQYWSSKTEEFKAYFTHDYQTKETPVEVYTQTIKTLLTQAVEKRMMSERPVGCLLSGGLDSSLVAALLAKAYRAKGQQLQTFSIGLEGSPDLIAAQKVAKHIGSKHHSIVASESEFLAALEETVYILGSYDVTTIRASVGHQLVAKYVAKNTDVKVLFSGETADEFGSYLYFQNAPSEAEFQAEAIRLLKDIHFFDMKRGDRCISNAGLEARVPFADKTFVQYYMSIPPKERQFNDAKIEKYLIRKAFAEDALLPDEVLWRRKNGFSDSVSAQSKSWSSIIKSHVDLIVSDKAFELQKHQFSPVPSTKEAFYYRQLFAKYYANHHQLTPYQWLPKWCGDVIDPSARVLEIYQAD
ncbi:asparagine synthase (glutamine-hydrolysing) [Psychroflexus salarius]|uniref:asparagine synthase (glutamine-hydrolyzing) n=1 Tax=Psychroflexus salarius TaxID=1155689 RepID=A0A1M4V4T8_9FLAO|nr:asparagine synthase-related protein [Psychroflexus salarius]SHE63930.1 asparagine synthase (glutamine-hydrolysing) [Psychroflexus salarius]